MRFRSCLVLVITACLLGSSARGQTTQPATDYFAIYLQGKKVGYAMNRRTPAEGKVRTTAFVFMTLGRGGLNISVTTTTHTEETADGKPLRLSHSQNLAAMSESVRGKIVNGKLEATITTGGQTRTQTLDWPAGALLPEGAELLARKHGLAEGTRYSYKHFAPDSLSAYDVSVIVGPKKAVDLLGRVVTLVEVRQTLAAATGKIEAITYVDEDYKPLKTVTQALGMQIEMIACSREFARSQNEDVSDFLDKFFLASPQRLTGLSAAKSATYEIHPANGGKAENLNFRPTDSQSVRRGGGGTVFVTVRPVSPPAGATLPYQGRDEQALAAMKPTRTLQSDNEKIIALARKAASDATDAATAARRMEKFVKDYIHAKDLSVGYATAAEVAENRQGDCTEHAVLLAAMLRSAGIPAQVVTGVTYAESFGGRNAIFAPHAWVRARIGEKWVDYDAALGFDAGHIALSWGDGESDDFFAVANTLGYFKIVKATLEK
ncbi:MAG TPA: transglutaminase domain-containing protein [Phycisphaerae bacterium]|nr:transglutaminase domain-containing protein [Phycisphaerae bacterium]